MYINHMNRLKSQQNISAAEVGNVIKGTTRNVIVVKSPDPKVFDEAIFIVREDYMRSGGLSRTQLLDDARKAADGYIGSLRKPKRIINMPALWITLSAVGGTGVGLLIMLLVG